MTQTRDITGDIGPLFFDYYKDAKYRMYSFDTPAYCFWQGVFNGLQKLGYTHKRIMEIFQAKDVRWWLDIDSDEIEKLGEKMALEYWG